MLRERASHFDMVRCGIAVYGIDPFGADPLEVDLEPALALSSYVAEVKRCETGESAGYGRRFIAERRPNIGVVPIGYGDGWRRGLLGQRRGADRRGAPSRWSAPSAWTRSRSTSAIARTPARSRRSRRS